MHKLWLFTLTLLKYFALALCVICLLISLFFLYRFPGYLDPQGGGEDGSCFSLALPAIPNGSGLVVSGHHTMCDDIIHSSAVYVYLRRSGEVDDSRHLIFRYLHEDGEAEPRATWTSKSTLSISVGTVVLVSKAVPSLEGVSISYAVKHEKYPRSDEERETRTLKIVAVGFFILGVAMITLCVIIIRSLRRGSRKRNT
jgi:hypothetical protein